MPSVKISCTPCQAQDGVPSFGLDTILGHSAIAAIKARLELPDRPKDAMIGSSTKVSGNSPISAKSIKEHHPVFVETKVRVVHVGLDEHEAFTADTDRRRAVTESKLYAWPR